MEKQAMSQMKRQYKAPEKQVNEPETGNFPEKEFKTIVQMQDLGKRMEANVKKMQELFTKDLIQTDKYTGSNQQQRRKKGSGEITATEQNAGGKKAAQKGRQPKRPMGQY